MNAPLNKKNNAVLSKDKCSLLLLSVNKTAGVMFRGALVKAGYKEVQISTEEETAREILAKSKFDLVLCDSDFGKEMHGKEIFPRIYNDLIEGKGSTFVLLLPPEAQQKQAQANAIGIEEILFQPITVNTLLTEVERLLAKREMLDGYQLGIEEVKKMIADKAFTKALEELKIIVTMNKVPFEGLYLLGYVYLLINDLDQAETNFLQAVACKPHHLKSLYGLAFIYSKKESYKALVETYSEMIFCLFDSWAIVRKMIKIFPLLPANIDWEKILQPIPSFINASDIDRKELSEALEKSIPYIFKGADDGRIERCFNLMKKILGLTDQLYFQMGKVLMDDEKIKLAEKYMVNITDQNIRDGEEFNLLQVRAYFMEGHFFKCIEMARKVKLRYPQSTQSHLYIVRSFIGLKDIERAQEALDDFKKLKPPSELFDQLQNEINAL